MRLFSIVIGFGLALPALFGPALCAPAAEMSALRRHHAWGRFGAGSWKQVRLVTETLDSQGRVTSISTTETKTTLEEVAPDGVTLKVEVTGEVAGKRFATQPQIVKQSYSGEPAGQAVTVKSLGSSTLMIDSHEIPCEIEEVETCSGAVRRTTLVHYSDKVAPYILRTKSNSDNPADKAESQETAAEVIALDMPVKVLTDIKSTAYVRVVQKNARGTTITLSVNAPDVPGGEVAYTSKKLDGEGRLVRRSTLELIAFRVEKSGGGPSDQVRSHRRHRDKARTGRR